MLRTRCNVLTPFPSPVTENRLGFINQGVSVDVFAISRVQTVD